MPEYLLIPIDRLSDRNLARCGILAGLLWSFARGYADSYGRLEASPEKLTDVVLKSWDAVGQTNIEQIREARDTLVRSGLWHYYQADGKEWVEYEGWDKEQTPTFRNRRSPDKHRPDPPDRPDLWACNRVHATPKRGTGQSDPPEPDPQPHGSADLPAEPAPAGVPSPVAVTREVSSSDEREEFIREGVRQLAKAQEQHSGSTLSPADHQKLRAAVEDAWDAQAPWQSLLTIMRTKQTEYQPTRTAPKIKSVGYYQAGWDAHIRAARDERKLKPDLPEPLPLLPKHLRPKTTADLK